MAGFGAENIDSFSFQAGPLWRGTGHASAILVPQHLAKYPRLHVEVTFKTEMTGPVLAGIGRHYGIGVFAGRSEFSASATLSGNARTFSAGSPS